jgi:hypothetical protein
MFPKNIKDALGTKLIQGKDPTVKLFEARSNKFKETELSLLMKIKSTIF